MPPVVGAPLVVAVANAPAVVQAPTGALVVVQDQVETPMETDEDELLAKLFFKKYGRALPIETEKEKEKESEVDQIKFVIDLTDEPDENEMEVATPVVETVIVKKEPIENVTNVASVTDVAKLRQERRELVKGRKALIAFGKTLRKSNVIPEKEAPIENVVAESNVSADASVTTVNPESITTDEAIEMAEKAIAESDVTIAANQQEFTAEFGDTPLDEFDDESEFRLFPDDTDVINDDDDAMIDDI
jgi:hypothetical protein